MGKLAPRLNSRKNAKRWAKGKSSSSNPETKKYRDQARSIFFPPIQGPKSGLTAEVLRKHDALQGTKIDETENVEFDDIESSAGASTFKTFGTFASSWSNCSNLSFSRFLNNFQSKSAIHKEMLAVLAAVTEVIKQNGGEETSTEYFGALITILETAESEESVTAILSLLGMGIKTVPKNVLKVLFGQASKIFIDILSKYALEEQFAITRLSIGCLSTLLRVQEAAAWSNSSTMQVLHAILAFTINSKPRVRKAAQHGICAILKGSDMMKSDDPPPYHPCAPQVAKHCLTQLEMTGQPGQMTCTLHILTLLKEIIHQLPKAHVKSVCEGLLSIMTLNNVLVTSCCFQTLHGLFVSKPVEAVLPAQLNAQIINALYDYQPPPGDTQPTLAWLAVMQEAHCNLAVNSLQLCAANITAIIEKCIDLWMSDKTEVLTGTTHTIKALLEACIAPICENEETVNKYKPTLVKTILLIQQGMKYQFNLAWHRVLHILAVVFQTIGPHCEEELVNILKGLADLRDSHKFTYNSEIEYAVGAAVRSLGPEIVLSAIPLQTGDDVVDLRRSWLLPVLKDCISNARLSYFVSDLLPLAERCEHKSKTLQGNNDGIGAHTHNLLTSQIWALLPSFCNNAKDIKDSFKNIARVLGIAIAGRKDLRLSIMASLRKLIQKSVENDNKEDVEELARFAKNYLPLLFNLYTVKPVGSEEEGQRLATLETIKVYLPITSKELVGEFFNTALTKLDSEETDAYTKESVFDLIRVLTQYTDEERIKSLHDKCVPLLSDAKNHKEQKKAYRFLEEICGSESEVCKQYVSENRKKIQKDLVASLSTVHNSCKGARIRCLTHLIKCHPQLEKTKFLKAVVPEAVMGVKELNEKCRTSAYNLLNIIAQKFFNNSENLQEYTDILLEGMDGTVQQRSATLLALASITYNYNGSLSVQKVLEILNHACGLMCSPTREVVLASLAFVKVYLSVMPTPIIGPTLQGIVKALTNMNDDCKRHFRQKVRDLFVKMIRKFGGDIITEMVPASDQNMHKRLKNIRKIEGRKQKSKEHTKKNATEDDSEDEFNVKRRPKSMEEILADSDDEVVESEDEKTSNQKRKTKKKTWIQETDENIVDFIDPSVSKNITATQPGTSTEEAMKSKKKDYGFKKAPDGRLIIADDNDEDMEDDKKPKKKKKLPFMDNGSDNEDDDAEDDAKSEVQTKKRKLLDTESVASSMRSKYTAGGSGIHRPLKKAKEERKPGAEYRSKKAKGDVKRKGKHEPYAYYPLSRSALNKRKNKGKKNKFNC